MVPGDTQFHVGALVVKTATYLNDQVVKLGTALKVLSHMMQNYLILLIQLQTHHKS